MRDDQRRASDEERQGATADADRLFGAGRRGRGGRGKHYIHGGGWDTLFSRTFPFVHATLGVAIRLRVPWSETGRPATFTLDVLDADGHTILPDPPGTIHGTLDVGRPSHLFEGDDQVIPLALSINNLRFTGPGLYVVICHLDGEAMARAPFRVMQAQGTPPSQPQD